MRFLFPIQMCRFLSVEYEHENIPAQKVSSHVSRVILRGQTIKALYCAFHWLNRAHSYERSFLRMCEAYARAERMWTWSISARGYETQKGGRRRTCTNYEYKTHVYYVVMFMWRFITCRTPFSIKIHFTCLIFAYFIWRAVMINKQGTYLILIYLKAHKIFGWVSYVLWGRRS